MGEIPGLDEARVSEFLRQRVPGADGPFRFELISGGRSNLTYRVRSGPRSFALRRPPLGHVIATAHDMAREYRVLAALADTPVPVPRPLALCEDEATNGAPFYVMEFCEGVVLQDRVPDGFLDRAEDGRRVSQALVDTLACLHAIDFAAVGLEGFGRPRGYLERQVRRWAKQWEANRTAPLPEIETLLARLAAALPEESAETIVHGDYRLGNMALAAENSEVEASAVTTRPGFFTRDEIVAGYAKASGRDVSAIDFYQVLALTKLAVISEGIYKRFTLGKTVGEGFERLRRATAPLAERALAIADRADDPRLRG
jgi:aminoglycoside phosphotransferase (APT) family kinase protein